MKHLLILLLFAALAFTTREAYRWKHEADRRGYYAEASGAYLFGPSGVLDASGADVSRQQLIDTYLHQYAESLGLRFKKKK